MLIDHSAYVVIRLDPLTHANMGTPLWHRLDRGSLAPPVGGYQQAETVGGGLISKRQLVKTVASKRAHPSVRQKHWH